MGNVEIGIGLQLWQIVFSAFICLLTIVALTFSAAVTFVRRSECSQCTDNIAKSITQLYDIVRDIKTSVGRLEGKVEK